MISLLVKTIDTMSRVASSASKAAFRNFGHAAASISKRAKASIRQSSEPSPPGSPPHTRRGQLRRAIRFHANHHGAVIGPAYSVAGESGRAHEMGGWYRGQEFDERPFMQPAMSAEMSRFRDDWHGSIGE